MPSPNARRDSFLKYLQSDLTYALPWVDEWGSHSPEEVKRAMRLLKQTDPEYYHVLHLYMTSRMTRQDMSNLIAYEYSTVKRKLDYAIDCILSRLAHRDLSLDIPEP
jgi:hypothetical protein